MKTIVPNHRKREIISILIAQGKPGLANAVAKMVITSAVTIIEECPSVKKQILATLIEQKRPDLANLIAIRGTPVVSMHTVVAAPGYRKIPGSGKFDVETTTAAVKITADRPNYTVDVYSPIENIGKRGQEVEKYHYQLMASTDDRKGWKGALAKALKKKPDAPLNEVLSTIRSLFQKAERESIARADAYPSRLYGPHKSSLKGVSASIPDLKSSPAYAGRRGKDITIAFEKPTIYITSKRASNLAQANGEYHYLTVSWSFAKKMGNMAKAVSRLRNMNEAAAALEEAGVSYKVNQYAA